jgi:hypothetical protein
VASIRASQKPELHVLHATCVLTDGAIQTIKDALGNAPSIKRVFLIDLVDAEGFVHASIEKTIYIRRNVTL